MAEDWAVVEICSGLICASLVPLRLMLKNLCGRSRRRRQMNHPKFHAQPAQISHNVASRGQGEVGLNFNTKMATIITCDRNNDIERCERAVASDVLLLWPESRHLRLSVPDKALTRDHITW